MVKTEIHGSLPNGKIAHLYSFVNIHGASAQVSTYGGMLVSLSMPDRQGRIGPVSLGLAQLEDYINANTNYGGIVGRYANRIGQGGFHIDGQFYPLAKNQKGKVHLHGGFQGFDRRLWVGIEFEERASRGVVLNYLSPDTEEGYPGTLNVTVKYELTDNNELIISYLASSDQPTVVNLSHHAYFNLSGDSERSVLDNELKIEADYFTPTDESQLPTGLLASVAGTPLDFRSAKPIGKDIEVDHPQLVIGGGYDHNFVVRGETGQLRPAAEVYDPFSGRTLMVETTQPGLQLYTANWLDGSQLGADGRRLMRRCAFCLETQHFPNSPNQPGFPSTLLRPGELYDQQAVFRFGIRSD